MFRTIIVFVFVTLALGFGVTAYASFGDISLTHPKMVSMPGQELTRFHVGQQIGVESALTSHATLEKRFTYLVQVMNNNGQIVYFEGLSASILPNQTFTVSQSWIPKESGLYTVQTVVWDSLMLSTPITDVFQTQVMVE